MYSSLQTLKNPSTFVAKGDSNNLKHEDRPSLIVRFTVLLRCKPERGKAVVTFMISSSSRINKHSVVKAFIMKYKIYLLK